MTKQTELEKLADEAYEKGDFSNAIEKYETILVFAQSRLIAAELAHKIAISYRGLHNYRKYLQYEKIASDSICSEQGAEFLKEAGDYLCIIGETELSVQAYGMASFFYAQASDVEDEIDSVLSMNAWSTVCKAKTLEIDSIEIWIEASKMFLEAAEKSEGILANYRYSKAYHCLAMSKIFNGSSGNSLKEANELLIKASNFDKNNTNLNINLIAIQILLDLADTKEDIDRYSEKKNVILKNLLELSSCIRILGSLCENLAFNLDFLANKIKEEDSPDIEHLDEIWKALLSITHIFAL
jgi:hypothetical protein